MLSAIYKNRNLNINLIYNYFRREVFCCMKEIKRLSLVVLAAGMGSRFIGGIKQLAKIGSNGETILEFSIDNAIESGFNKIVFIIRQDIDLQFREQVGNKYEQVLGKDNVFYVYQEIDLIPDYIKDRDKLLLTRKKPWGTGHALAICKDVVHEPFCVINSDDYYGSTSFNNIYKFMSSNEFDDKCNCCVGYNLCNTVPEATNVNRGICSVNDKGFISSIDEVKGIHKTDDKIIADDNIIDGNVIVSMNMMGLSPYVLKLICDGLDDFLLNINISDNTDEYLLSEIVNQLLSENIIAMKMIPTDDKWVGITSKLDIDNAKAVLLR